VSGQLAATPASASAAKALLWEDRTHHPGRRCLQAKVRVHADNTRDATAFSHKEKRVRSHVAWLLTRFRLVRRLAGAAAQA